MAVEIIQQIAAQLLEEIQTTTTIKQIEEIRVKALGKNSEFNNIMQNFSKLSALDRKTTGQALNNAKTTVTDAINEQKHHLEGLELEKQLIAESIDTTLPGRLNFQQQGKHIISKTIKEIGDICQSLGFKITEDRDIESDWYNFTALNIPETHPARQMHDTFYINPKETNQSNNIDQLLLRTHTSSVQIRYMQQNPNPPMRVASVGRVYRADYDATHSPMFHQVEGLYVTENTNMAELKSCLQTILTIFFGLDKVKLRFRSSYFPFVEPGAEVDICCKIDRTHNKIIIGEGDDWLEILGCGMVHPKVLSNVGIDPIKYRGFAFGIGVERMAMLKYGVGDIRDFYENDARWLRNYSSVG